MKRILAGVILLALLLGGTAQTAFNKFQLGYTPNTALKQENFFGLTGSAWQTPSTYYVPGTGNPAVSTADYYHLNGLAWARFYDLTATDCGATGASIAASRGRYLFVTSPDHPGGNYNWNGGYDFRIGYSNDPGVLPSTLTSIYNNNYTSNITVAAQIASFTGSISGTTLTASSVVGLITNDNHATLNGAGVTANTIIVSQLTGTQGGSGTYQLSISQTVGSVAMTATQTNYSLYQNPFFVCNPDDATYPFYLYAEGAASGIQHEEGLIKSADLVTWTAPQVTHVTPTFSSWSSYQRPVRDGVNSWHSVGFQFSYTATGNVFTRAKWTSTDGQIWTPASSVINTCIPSSSTTIDCPGATAVAADMEAAPDSITVGAQTWSISALKSYVSGSRSGQEWVGRAPIDANYNILSSPALVKVSAAYAGNYPGPTYLQSNFGFVEDGIAHYWGLTGFFTSSSIFGLVNAATYANGGGLWQQGLDYYTEIIDASAAAGAAPVGVKATCASSVASLTWFDSLPTQTYRLYRGTSAGSQPTLVGDFTGTSATDSGMTLNAVTYYKLVYLNGGTEQKNRVTSTWCSSDSAFVNAHYTRASAGGADMTTCNRTMIVAFDAWLVSNSLSNNLLLGTMPDFCVAKSGSVISKIFDMGTTRLPRGGDYTTLTANTSYNATGISGKPAWVNSTSGASGYYGGGLFNNIRRKTQITLFSAYQKPGTGVASAFAVGQFTSRILLTHTSGSPGAVNCLLSDATQQKTATATVAGLATDFHTMGCTFDGTTWLAYSDASAGSGQTGLVIPSPDLNPPDMLTGQVGFATNIHTLISGSDTGLYDANALSYSAGIDALYSGRAQFVFDKALSGSQITSLDALVR